MNDRPTPETESHFPSSRHKDDSWVVSCEIGLIRDFERERDEAREEAAMWKANHDNQVKLKAALMDRPDLGDRARKVVSLAKERDEAREQVRQLQAWKDEMLFIESQWDLQAVGRELGLPLGSSIRSEILPAILKLKKP